MALISELRRRNIFRVAVLYVLAAWLLLQCTDILVGVIGRGDWVYRFEFGLLVICFPLTLIFSYLYEITPQGLRKEREVQREHSITTQTARKIDKIIVIVLALAIALEIGRWLLR